MTVRDRIVDYLREHPEGADDDELAIKLDLQYRQQVNQRCRTMVVEGVIDRRVVNGKIRNFLRNGGADFAIRDSGTAPARTRGESTRATVGSPLRPWFWEGNVQSAVVAYLVGRGYSIDRVANTATKEAGKDIEASMHGRVLWVTVKGFPVGTPRTQPTTQARHWFTQATFDIVAWRGESGQASLAMALPDFPTYRKLSLRLAWLFQTAGFGVLWVQQTGRIETEGQV